MLKTILALGTYRLSAKCNLKTSKSTFGWTFFHTPKATEMSGSQRETWKDWRDHFCRLSTQRTQMKLKKASKVLTITLRLRYKVWQRKRKRKKLKRLKKRKLPYNPKKNQRKKSTEKGRKWHIRTKQTKRVEFRPYRWVGCDLYWRKHIQLLLGT